MSLPPAQIVRLSGVAGTTSTCRPSDLLGSACGLMIIAGKDEHTRADPH
jgi:hypothetical protein